MKNLKNNYLKIISIFSIAVCTYACIVKRLARKGKKDLKNQFQNCSLVRVVSKSNIQYRLHNNKLYGRVANKLPFLREQTKCSFWTSKCMEPHVQSCVVR